MTIFNLSESFISAYAMLKFVFESTPGLVVVIYFRATTTDQKLDFDVS